MADGEYRIRIVTESSGKGAQETRDELREIRDEAQKVEKAVAEIDPLEDLAQEAKAGIESMRQRLEALQNDLAETRGFDDLEDSAGDALNTIAKLEAELEAVNRQLRQTKIGSAEFKALEQRAGALKQEIANARGEQSGLASSGVAGLAKLAGAYLTVQQGVKLVTAAISEAAEAEESAQRIRQAGANKGIYDPAFIGEVRKFAEELEATLGVTDSAVENAVQRLLPNVDASELRGALKVIENLTPIYGDIESATNAWTKALNGNFDSLREQGFVLDSTADKTEKLAQIQEQAAKRGAGLLAASAAGLNSEWERVKDNFGDVLGTFGGVVAETVNLSGVLGQVADALSAVSGKSAGAAADLDRFTTAGAAVQQMQADADGYAQSLGRVQTAIENTTAALQAQVDAIRNTKQAEDELAKARLERDIARVETSDDRESDKRAKVATLEKEASQARLARELAAIDEETAAIAAAVEEQEATLAKVREEARQAAERQRVAREYDAAITGVQKELGGLESQLLEQARRDEIFAQRFASGLPLINPVAGFLAPLANEAGKVVGKKADQDRRKGAEPQISDFRARIAELEAERAARGVGTPETEATRMEAAQGAATSATESSTLEENRRQLEELARRRRQIQQVEALRQETAGIRARSGIEAARESETAAQIRQREAAEAAAAAERTAQRRGVAGLGGELAKGLQGEVADARNPERAEQFVSKFEAAVGRLGSASSGNELGTALTQLITIVDQLNTKAAGLEAQNKALAERFQREVQRLQQTVRNNPTS